MFLRSRALPVLKAGTLLPSVSRLSRQCGILNISQPYRPPRPVTGSALFLCIKLRLSHWLALSPAPFLSALHHCRMYPAVLTRLKWSRRQQVPPKRRYLFIKLHGVTQKNSSPHVAVDFTSSPCVCCILQWDVIIFTARVENVCKSAMIAGKCSYAVQYLGRILSAFAWLVTLFPRHVHLINAFGQTAHF
jgi:hypothetical protein